MSIPTTIKAEYLRATAAEAALSARLAALEAKPARPFPAPVTSRTVTLPPSLDITGVTEVSAALNTFIASVPDGSVIDFGAAKLRLLQGIQIAKRTNLVFQFNGIAQLIMDPAASPSDYLASPFCLGHTYGGFWDNGNSDIAILGAVLVGNSSNPGIYAGGEGQHSLCLTGTTRLEVAGCTGSAAFGDFLFLNGVTDAWAHDSHALTAGRNGVSVIAGTRITVERTALDVCGYCTLDVEPNVATDACSAIVLRAGTGKTWGNCFLALDGSDAGAPISGVTVDGWTISADSVFAVVGYSGPVAKARPSAISVTNNRGSVVAASRFSHIDGLTVAGNLPTSVVTVVDCTGVIVR